LKKVIPSVVKREELFITSKLWNSSHQAAEAEKELDKTLEQLGIEYLDLYCECDFRTLVPSVLNASSDPLAGRVQTWARSLSSKRETGRGCTRLGDLTCRYLEGDDCSAEDRKGNEDLNAAELPPDRSFGFPLQVKQIGVSNFTIQHIQGIIDATGVVPAANQIEAHPYLPQDELVAYAKEKGIHITAYSPLGNNLVGKPKLTDLPAIQAIADELGATAAQVLVAWGVYRGYSVIPKSVQEERIHSNFRQVELSQAMYEKVSAVGRENYTRYVP
jgi:L-glyceraldehyde reductase